jgi:ornithine cyclodeaminase
LLLVGSGQLAPWMARAHCALRPGLKQVLVWGREAARAAAVAGLLAAEGLPARAVHDLPAAVAAAHIVCCATTASAPVLRGAWLAPGTHLDLVGAFRPDLCEADAAAIARCRIVVDTFEGALAEGGDLVQAMSAGAIARADVACDLAQLLRGAAPPAREGADCSLFKSVGSAIEDLAAAALVVSANASRASTCPG